MRRHDERVGGGVRAHLDRPRRPVRLRTLGVLLREHRGDGGRIGGLDLKQPQRRQVRPLDHVQPAHVVRDQPVLGVLGRDQQRVRPLDHGEVRVRDPARRIDRVGGVEELAQRLDDLGRTHVLNIDDPHGPLRRHELLDLGQRLGEQPDATGRSPDDQRARGSVHLDVHRPGVAVVHPLRALLVQRQRTLHQRVRITHPHALESDLRRAGRLLIQDIDQFLDDGELIGLGTNDQPVQLVQRLEPRRDVRRAVRRLEQRARQPRQTRHDRTGQGMGQDVMACLGVDLDAGFNRAQQRLERCQTLPGSDQLDLAGLVVQRDGQGVLLGLTGFREETLGPSQHPGGVSLGHADKAELLIKIGREVYPRDERLEALHIRRWAGHDQRSAVRRGRETQHGLLPRREQSLDDLLGLLRRDVLQADELVRAIAIGAGRLTLRAQRGRRVRVDLAQQRYRVQHLARSRDNGDLAHFRQRQNRRLAIIRHRAEQIAQALARLRRGDRLEQECADLPLPAGPARNVEQLDQLRDDLDPGHRPDQQDGVGAFIGPEVEPVDVAVLDLRGYVALQVDDRLDRLDLDQFLQGCVHVLRLGVLECVQLGLEIHEIGVDHRHDLPDPAALIGGLGDDQKVRPGHVDHAAVVRIDQPFDLLPRRGGGRVVERDGDGHDLVPGNAWWYGSADRLARLTGFVLQRAEVQIVVFVRHIDVVHSQELVEDAQRVVERVRAAADEGHRGLGRLGLADHGQAGLARERLEHR